MFNLPQPIAPVVANLSVEGEVYDISYFNIFFDQDVDHKGKPQHEVTGGIFKIILKDAISDNIYDWAKRSTKRKSGKISFNKKLVSTELTIIFEDAYCIKLTKHIDSYTGMSTTLIVSPKKININGMSHDNGWKDKE